MYAKFPYNEAIDTDAKLRRSFRSLKFLQMEDPIRFDVWAKIAPSAREDALAALRANGVYVSEIELRKAVSESIRNDALVKVAKYLPLSTAENIMANSAWLSEPRLYQEGYSDSEKAQFCPKHELHFGGCLGCHICRNFYVQ